jgi:signal transduction histidine kinase/HPt (histidine-containing phosphotransfer) domain-containing protein/ActR/RegA family two-component response regulator
LIWQLAAVANCVVAVAYLAIAWLIVGGLWRTGQFPSNKLATATGAIFLYCGIHHGSHALHLLLPSIGLDRGHGLAARRGYDWSLDAWDVLGAGVAVYYLSLRRGFGRLLHSPEMFQDEARRLLEESIETERRQMEQELRASREQALEASRLKSEFVANMSHEIRTPLNGVVCMSELLLASALTGDQREYAQVALTSAEALMRVINDILDFSKIEAGKLDIVDEEFSLETAVGEVCAIVGVKAREQELELVMSIDDAVPDMLRGDSNRIQQVLMNLLSNAVKFTAEGEVIVRASLERSADAAERLRLEVSDTGIGIDPERDLFQPFDQGDATTTRRYGGTGLGLSIAKQLVELMAGEIGVQSSPGGGSRFWFTLPCRRVTRTVDAPSAQPQPQPQPAVATAGRSGRALVAEDNPVNQFAATRLLQTLGFTVDIAKDGREAVDMSARRDYRVMFMDCHMPELDGYAATEAIRLRERGDRRMPIIAMTASALDGDRDRCLAAGMDDYLAKPLRIQTLTAMIKRLPGAGTPDGPSPPADPSPPAEIAVFRAAALESSIGDPEAQAALVSMFLDHVAEVLPEVGHAIETADGERLVDLAHGLQGSAAVVGASRIVELSGALRQAAADGLGAQATETYLELVDALPETRVAMTAYIEEISP